jgi:hypothetical protein
LPLNGKKLSRSTHHVKLVKIDPMRVGRDNPVPINGPELEERIDLL